MDNNGLQGDHPIVLLPEELRGEIFRKFPQNEANSLRRVCKQWDKDIKNFYEFTISLEDDSPVLYHVLQLRIVHLKVRTLALDRIQLLPSNPNHGPEVEKRAQLTFKHPNLIRTITVTPARPYEISPIALKALLQLCQETVINLDMEFCYGLLVYQFPYTNCYNFQNVRTLKIRFRFFLLYSPRTTVTDNSLVSLIGNKSAFPNLKSLEIGMWGDSRGINLTKYFSQLCKLVTKNPKGLEDLCVNFHNSVNGVFDPELSPEELMAFKAVTNLKAIHFDSEVNQGADYIRPLWLNLILNQRMLERLSLGDHFSCTISGSSLKHIGLSNYETLVELDIPAVNIDQDPGPLDLSIFKNCHKLEGLSLMRDDRLISKGSGTELIALASLPQNLVRLALQKFNILSKELYDFFDSNRLPAELEDLRISECGDGEEFGFDSAVLDKILNLGYKKVATVFLNSLKCSFGDGKESMRQWIVKEFGNPPAISKVELTFIR